LAKEGGNTMIPATQEPIANHGRVLIVDDDRAMCQLLIDLLREEGYETDVAYEGETALQKSRQSYFDLTITDLMMPKMRGVELVQRLREIDNGALVLLITGFGTIESAVEAMRAGAFHYVTKPFLNE
jgi:DNA-binding NtrC family response regulator